MLAFFYLAYSSWPLPAPDMAENRAGSDSEMTLKVGAAEPLAAVRCSVMEAGLALLRIVAPMYRRRRELENWKRACLPSLGKLSH